MEIEGKKKNPSLPRNYVSLALLQERWMEEQKRKKRDKEEEEGREMKQKEAEEEEEEERRRREKEGKEELKRRADDEAERNPNLVDQIKQQRWNRNVNRSEDPPRRLHQGKSFRPTGVSGRNSQESQIRVISVNDENETKQQKKSGRNRLGQQDQNGRNLNINRSENNELPHGQRSPINRPSQSSVSGFETTVVGGQNSEESLIGVVSVGDVNEKKKRKKSNRRRPRVKENQSESIELISPEYEKADEHIPAALAKRHIGKEFHWNGRTADYADSEKRVPVRKIWIKKAKPRAEENKTRGRNQELPEYKKKSEEIIPVCVAEPEVEIGTKIEVQKKGKQLVVVKDNGQRKEVNRPREIEGNFVDPSLHIEIRGFKTNVPDYNSQGKEDPVTREMGKKLDDISLNDEKRGFKTNGHSSNVYSYQKKHKGGVVEPEDEIETKTDFQKTGKQVVVVNKYGQKKKERVNRSRESGKKLVDLCPNDESRVFKTNVDGYRKKHNGGYGQFSGWRALNPRDSSMIWVRKDNTSDTKVAEFVAEVRTEQ